MLQKRAPSGSVVMVQDLLTALEPHGFSRPMLKRLCPSMLDNDVQVEWAQLGLEAEAKRPMPPPPIRVSTSIADLRGLLSQAASELRKGAQVAGAMDSVVAST